MRRRHEYELGKESVTARHAGAYLLWSSRSDVRAPRVRIRDTCVSAPRGRAGRQGSSLGRHLYSRQRALCDGEYLTNKLGFPAVVSFVPYQPLANLHDLRIRAASVPPLLVVTRTTSASRTLSLSCLLSRTRPRPAELVDVLDNLAVVECIKVGCVAVPVVPSPSRGGTLVDIGRMITPVPSGFGLKLEKDVSRVYSVISILTSIAASAISLSLMPEKSPLANCSYLLAFCSMIALRVSSSTPSVSENTRLFASDLACCARRLTRPGEGRLNGSLDATWEEVVGGRGAPFVYRFPSLARRSACSAVRALRSRRED